MNRIVLIILFLGAAATGLVRAQNLTQTIRGYITDTDTKIPLVGVTLYIDGSDPLVGTVTDPEGKFTFPPLAVGRYNIGINYLGYEQKMIPNILLGAGKEVNLQVELTERVEQLEEVVVTARKNKGEPLNEMASVSARSVTVEETQRFAGSFNDPSRMVSSYAGITSDPSGNNDIVIRGNSPRGLTWRIEGVEVPNPNHFANEGATGGPISILNSATLGNSDFLTGAFPAEFGNAYSGVFDINMRQGNNQKHEYTAQIGVIGTDLTAEGPFSSKSSASYLVNYRYSSLSLLNAAGVKVAGDAVPKFQDMTYNIMLPTNGFGSFQFFGVGGLSTISFEEPEFKQDYDADMIVSGLNHILPLSDKTYLHSSISFSGTRNEWFYQEWETEPDHWETKGTDKMLYGTWSAAMNITHKFSAKNTLKIGITGSVLNYNLFMDTYDNEDKVLYNSLKDAGSSELYQSYVNWKFRPVANITFNTGVHYKYFKLNGHYSLEPRIGARWQFTEKQALSAGFGLHSKTDQISLYLLKVRQDDGSAVQINRNLDFLKSRHYIVGYEYRLTRNLNLKAEAYYQDLFNVPIEAYAGSSYSILNESAGYIFTQLNNNGTGTNYGLELGIERFFAKNYYFLLTGSLFDAKYTPMDGVERNTRFNNQYITNVVGGKEFPVGKRRNSSINVNIRSSLAGGQYYTPIDVEQSRQGGYTVYDNTRAYSKQYDPFFRTDLKISFRRNKNKTTRVWELDIENVTNQLNVTGTYWDDTKQEIVEYTQMGLLPTVNYRIEF